jgi:calcineurin-like phosphoesterase
MRYCDFRTEATFEIRPWVSSRWPRFAWWEPTHIPLRPRILKGGTALMADAGMCGDFDSIIGVEADEPLNRFLTGMAQGRFTPAEGEATLCGVAP